MSFSKLSRGRKRGTAPPAPSVAQQETFPRIILLRHTRSLFPLLSHLILDSYIWEIIEMWKRTNITSAVAERQQSVRLKVLFIALFFPLIRFFSAIACILPRPFGLICDELLPSAFPNTGVSLPSIIGTVLFDDSEGTDCEIQLQSNSVDPRPHKSWHTRQSVSGFPCSLYHTQARGYFWSLAYPLTGLTRPWTLNGTVDISCGRGEGRDRWTDCPPRWGRSRLTSRSACDRMQQTYHFSAFGKVFLELFPTRTLLLSSEHCSGGPPCSRSHVHTAPDTLTHGVLSPQAPGAWAVS